MTTIDPQSLRGSTMLDSTGSKIGKVDNVFFDTETGKPEWAAISTGFFGKKVSLVPLATATPTQDGFQVPFEKGMVKDAPHYDPDGELSPQEEAELFRYYGVPYGGRTVTAQGGAPQGSGVGTGAGGGRDDAMTRSEEQVTVDKTAQPTGTVRLRKWVETEPVEFNVPVAREQARVEREPITDQNVEAAMSGPELSEAVHEETLHEEHVTTQKQTVPQERVRLQKETVVGQEHVAEEVGKERVEVEDPDRQL
jgi:uncharacterized protein (TIGR02271 family)